MPDKYVFRKYTPLYQKYFAQERKLLKDVLGESANIEHVGSTAVPGLGGKEIVDILLGVSRSGIETAKTKLEKADYEFRPQASTPERLFFRRDYVAGQQKRRVHLHLVERVGSEWQQFIFFRDYLRENPIAVEEYIKIKKEAVKMAGGDGKKYREHKEEFIVNVLQKI
ncbi:GrpB family protein [Patescibacteria group bacterium]|nr:GrpB family protein [Patescibacteria group bacterium]